MTQPEPLDLEAVARLANAVRSRHCEPGADRQSYNLAQAALRLVAEVERLRADLAAARTISEHRMESAKAYAATVDILSADLRRIAAERDALVNLRDAARGLEVVLGAAAGRVNLADIEHQLSALLAALPPREEPRPTVWAHPPEPGPAVTAVVDRFGQRFERGTAHNDDGTEDEVWVGTLFAGSDGWDMVPDLQLTWETLMRNHSPLTDASTDEEAPL